MQALQQLGPFQAFRTAAGALRVGDWTLNKVDPDGLRFVASISVWLPSAKEPDGTENTCSK